MESSKVAKHCNGDIDKVIESSKEKGTKEVNSYELVEMEIIHKLEEVDVAVEIIKPFPTYGWNF